MITVCTEERNIEEKLFNLSFLCIFMFIYERRDAQAHPWQAHQIFPFNTDKLICDISMIFKRRFQKIENIPVATERVR